MVSGDAVSHGSSRWMLIDEVERRALPLLPPDPCYFLLNRISGGFSASAANSLIDDFKKDPYRFRNNPTVMAYKESAIQRFALNLASFLLPLVTAGTSITLVPMPTSKTEGDVAYDDRLVRLCERAAEAVGSVRVENVLHSRETVQASHHGGSRDVASISENILCSTPTWSHPLCVVLVDDVLTTGAHYVACREKVAALFPDCRVFIGAFLSIHRSDSIDYDMLGIRYEP